jgi:hypothetical protein
LILRLTTSSHSPTRSTQTLARILIAILAGCLAAAGGLNAAPVGAAPPAALPKPSITLPAGGSATFRILGLALGPAGTLPGSGAGVSTLAPTSVRAALYYGAEWGYLDSAPQQVFAAVWYIQNGAWPDSADHTVAERISGAA